MGVSTTLWLAVGAQIYPPNKFAQVVDVRECPMFKDYHNPNSTNYMSLRNPNNTDIPDIVRGTGIRYPATEYVEPE